MSEKINNFLEYKGCKSNLDSCNLIVPGRLPNINPNTGLKFTDLEKNSIYGQYCELLSDGLAEKDSSFYNEHF